MSPRSSTLSSMLVPHNLIFNALTPKPGLECLISTSPRWKMLAASPASTFGWFRNRSASPPSARAAAGDDGHVHPVGQGVQQLQVKAGLHPVGVDAVATISPAPSGRPAPPSSERQCRCPPGRPGQTDEPARHPLDIHAEHHALAAVPLGGGGDERGSAIALRC